MWRKAGANAEGRCLLHVPEHAPGTLQMPDGEPVSASRVLLLRLIEELLRYGERRRQLFEQSVSRIAALENPVVLDGERGGKQKVFPERSMAWYEFLRLEWSKRPEEEPRFLEEMRRSAEAAAADAEAPAEALAAVDPGRALPATLVTILNGGDEVDPKTGALRLLRTNIGSILARIGITPSQLGLAADARVLTDQMIRDAVRMSSRIILQIDLTQDPPYLKGNRPTRIVFPSIVVIIATTEGPALLVKDPDAPDFLNESDLPKGLVDMKADKKRVPVVLGAAPQRVAAAPKPAAASAAAPPVEPAASAPL